jgi:TonB family protein
MQVKTQPGGNQIAEAGEHWEGQVVNGEFRLLQYLGGSDHSAVYLTEFGENEPQKAAIKLIPDDIEDAETQLARWELAAHLSHPNLIRLLRTGRCQLDGASLLYVVMEYLPEDLSQILPERALSPTEARGMLEPTVSALAYLHGKGLVHGHIQPTNVLAIDDQLKISSDGIRAAGGPWPKAGEPSIYDAPENEGGATSPAGDIWALGVTVVETLTQQPPAWDRKEQENPIVPATIPEPFLEIARRCLRRDPQIRWTVGDIGACLKPEPQASLPPVQNVPQAAKPRTTLAPGAVPAAIAARAKANARGPRAPRKNHHFAMVAAACLVVAVAAILAAPKLFERQGANPQSTAAASKQPSSQPGPEARPAPPETQPPPVQADDEPANSVAAKPTAAATRSETPANADGGGVVPGKVAQQVLPDVPQDASNTIRGTVRVGVKVEVDAAGNVAGVSLDSAGPSQYFARKALSAAQNWRFTPPTMDGRNVASEWLLRFQFTRDGTNVIPTETKSQGAPSN